MVPSLKIQEGRILATPSLEISFQRYELPPEGRIERAPSSCGALPIATTPRGAVIIPLASSEAVWIGLAPVRDDVAVSVTLCAETSAGLCNLVTGRAWTEDRSGVVVPPTYMLHGITALEGGFWPITRTPAAADTPFTSALQIGTTSSADALSDDEAIEGAAEYRETLTIRINFVAPEEFVSKTGVSWDPLDTHAAYGGWQLP